MVRGGLVVSLLLWSACSATTMVNPVLDSHILHFREKDELRPRSICYTYVTTMLVTIMPGANSTRMGDTPGLKGTGSYSAPMPDLSTTNEITASDGISYLPGTAPPGSISADESIHVSSGVSGIESNTGGSEGPGGQITEQPKREVSSTLSQTVSSTLSTKDSDVETSASRIESDTIFDRPAPSDAIPPLAATSRSIAGSSLPLSLTPQFSQPGSATNMQKSGSNSLLQSPTVGSGGTKTNPEPGPSTPFTDISTTKPNQPVEQTQISFTGSTDINTGISSDSGTPTVAIGLRSSITPPPSTPAGTAFRSSLAAPSTTSSSTISTVLLSVEISAEAAEKNDTLSQRSLYWKRDETSGFVGDETYQNPDTCSNATLFRQTNGQLVSRQRPLSVDPAVDYINLSDYPGGSISTTFSVIGRILVWNNTAFYGGAARFCQLQSGAVYGLFTENPGPENCTLINLVVYTGKIHSLFLPVFHTDQVQPMNARMAPSLRQTSVPGRLHLRVQQTLGLQPRRKATQTAS